MSTNLTPATAEDLATVTGLSPAITARLIARPGPYDDLADDLEAIARRIREHHHFGDPRALGFLETVGAGYAWMGSWLPRLVRHARAEGASWAEIGDALGITRQAAHMRYSGLVDEQA